MCACVRSLSMVEAFPLGRCGDTHSRKAASATNTPIRPCVQVGAGEVAPVSRHTVQARFSSLGAGVAFALGLTAWGLFFSCGRGRVLHALDLAFFCLFEPHKLSQQG